MRLQDLILRNNYICSENINFLFVSFIEMNKETRSTYNNRVINDYKRKKKLVTKLKNHEKIITNGQVSNRRVCANTIKIIAEST